MVTPTSTDPSSRPESDDADIDAGNVCVHDIILPSGLALYWVASNIIGIIMQYFIFGWGSLSNPFGPKPEDKG